MTDTPPCTRTGVGVSRYRTGCLGTEECSGVDCYQMGKSVRVSDAKRLEVAAAWWGNIVQVAAETWMEHVHGGVCVQVTTSN